MKRLSEINETLWGGMVRRSSGSVVRKQDELEWIDLGPEFDCLWLNGVYEKDGRNEFTWDETKNIVSSIPGVDIPNKAEVSTLKLAYDTGTVYLEGSENHIEPIDGYRFWNSRGGVYALGFGEPRTLLVPSHAKYPILLVKRRVNETHWGGMVRRSSGEMKRKEDDIELMTLEEFCKYLHGKYRLVDHYKGLETYISNLSKFRAISFPLFMYGTSVYRIAIIYREGVIDEINILAQEQQCTEFLDKVKEDFNIDICKRNGGLEVKDKDGNVGARMCIRFIDTVIKNCKMKIYEEAE